MPTGKQRAARRLNLIMLYDGITVLKDPDVLFQRDNVLILPIDVKSWCVGKTILISSMSEM